MSTCLPSTAFWMKSCGNGEESASCINQAKSQWDLCTKNPAFWIRKPFGNRPRIAWVIAVESLPSFVVKDLACLAKSATNSNKVIWLVVKATVEEQNPLYFVFEAHPWQALALGYHRHRKVGMQVMKKTGLHPGSHLPPSSRVGEELFDQAQIFFYPRLIGTWAVLGTSNWLTLRGWVINKLVLESDIKL